MHKIEITGTNTVLSYPEDGTEFTRQQFIDFAGLSCLYMSNHLTWEQFKIKLTYALLGLRRDLDVKKVTIANMDFFDNLTRISKFAEGFFTEKKLKGEKPVKVVKPDFMKQKIPSFSIGYRAFHGPNDGLFNTKFGEYIQAHAYFNDFSESGLEHDLDMMIATLYRPKKRFLRWKRRSVNYDGDVRQKFNPNLTEAYALKICKLSFDIKYAIYLYMASCQYLIANTPNLELKGGLTMDLSSLFSSKGQGKVKKGLGLVGTLFDISQTNVFGNIDETSEQNTFDVFAYLCQNQEKLRKVKKK